MTTDDSHVEPPSRPWLAYYDEGVPSTLTYPDLPLADLLYQTAEACPSYVAMRFVGTTITYKRLSQLVERCAGGLQDLGIGPGDKVAIMLPNCPQFVIAFYAALRVGAVAVPTNPLYKEHEIQHQLQDSGAKALIALDLLYNRVKLALPQTAVQNVIVTGIQDFLPIIKARLYPLAVRRSGTPIPHLKGEKVTFFRTLLEHRPYDKPTPTGPDDLAVLQYTGGTTGVAKGAMLLNRNLVANTVQSHSWTPATSRGAATLCVTPFFHVYGLTVGMNSTIYSAGAMLLLPRFVIKDMLQTIRSYKPSIFPGVPTMYMGLAQEPHIKTSDCESLKVCISGSAPLPLEVQEAFQRKAGGHVVEGYGLTEASPVALANPIGRCKIGTIGVPFPDTDARVVDLVSGEPVMAGQPGELIIRGPQIMAGYWNRPDETAAVLTEDGWLRTGDIAQMDDEGYFCILDRAKDMIIASGFNIYPREVEEVLFTHPAVLEAAVAGVPDSYRGETVKAFVVLKPGMEATEAEIIAFARERLAVFKAPTSVEFRDELPKTIIGKVLRRALISGE